jgi:predicted GIY-YIG superfamily endonuclease
VTRGRTLRPAASCGPVGIVYLLHFTRAYEHARHYTGWTEDLLDRLDRHAAGAGARLMNVVSHAGIGFVLVRTCEGTRCTERAIKNAGGAVRYCPLCTPKPRNGHWGPLPADLTPRYYPARPQQGPRFILLPDLRYPAAA